MTTTQNPTATYRRIRQLELALDSAERLVADLRAQLESIDARDEAAAEPSCPRGHGTDSFIDDGATWCATCGGEMVRA